MTRYPQNLVSEPHHCNVNPDPDPAFHFNADTNPAFHFSTDPDSDSAPH
jgi:hypothetical protein